MLRPPLALARGVGSFFFLELLFGFPEGVHGQLDTDSFRNPHE